MTVTRTAMKGKEMNAPSADNWYDPEATTFGDRLSGAREEAGMEQEELARRLGVKLKTLRQWESDMSEPRANRLSMMAGMLNVSLLWLLTGEGDGPGGPEQGTLSPGVRDLLIELREIQTQMATASDRLARLERSLARVLSSEALEVEDERAA